MLTYRPGDLPLDSHAGDRIQRHARLDVMVKDAVAAGKMGPADIDEALKDAVNLAIMDMEEAGVDIISDGEMQARRFLLEFSRQGPRPRASGVAAQAGVSRPRYSRCLPRRRAADRAGWLWHGGRMALRPVARPGR